ncbi:sigma-54-dependent transcriptional regulator [Variovorax sp. HW608]|uniref:sigma-54-dependent transcriptional regulator n=1 Tax=Variovorax sp. HW608 TaxID=1034889 RepID=UPI000B5B0A88|nr:sigma-54 dependent transcriptional regulator [Variovorax sp. HW608]
MGHALIVEDDEDSGQMLASLVKREGHSAATASSLTSARRFLAMQPPDVLLLDLHLPDGNGLELFENADLISDTEVVLMTGQASLETSIQALRLGAADYLVKPINPQHLKSLLSRLIRPSKLQAEITHMTEQWRETGCFGPLIGASDSMQSVYRQIARVAATPVTVFIQGESGTGKELVARSVHELSRRREQPFLAINCGAISPHLIESEIFGHERGSFTGAERQHQGFFERAHGGTLFLDEVTEMPLNLQVKLLRVLENGTFMRVGSTQLQQTDTRIIAATNRDPADAVMRGALREDLLYRLNVFPLALPPLRERASDIPLLAEHFLEEMGREEQTSKRLTPEAIRHLQAYPWPGNVRELRNALQRAWVMAHGAQIDAEWLPRMPAGSPPAATVAAPSQAVQGGESGGPHLDIRIGTPLSEVERQLILATFEYCGQHKERTAALLGISMKTLYNRLKEYKL